MTISRRTALIGAVTLLAIAAAVADAPAAFPNKCSAGKEKCTGAKAAVFLACHAKAEAKGVVVDPDCLFKASDKFSECFTKLESKLVCFTTGDTAAIEAKVDAFVLDVVQELDPGFPTPVENKCSAAKKKCAAKKVAGLLGCYSKAAGKGNVVDAICLSKVQAKFDDPVKGCFAKIEAKLAATCLTTGDVAAIEAKSDAFAFDVASEVEPLCGNNTAETPFEGCDGTDDGACPGSCRPPGDLNECQCPVCGDHDVNQVTEQCDRTDDSACPGLCALDCTCSVCGNNVAEPLVETCDGTDDGACPGTCLPPGDPNECRCPICGDGDVNQLGEQCDGLDDGACPGLCLGDCQCAVCGNNVAEAPVESCDGTDDPACPGLCLPPADPNQCQCPVCGDDDVNQLSEQCDGLDDGACPGLCLVDCQCAVCGNDLVEGPEECDGTDDGACPGMCQPTCDCP